MMSISKSRNLAAISIVFIPFIGDKIIAFFFFFFVFFFRIFFYFFFFFLLRLLFKWIRNVGPKIRSSTASNRSNSYYSEEKTAVTLKLRRSRFVGIRRRTTEQHVFPFLRYFQVEAIAVFEIKDKTLLLPECILMFITHFHQVRFNQSHSNRKAASASRSSS
jgi:hypothetical protein